MQNTERPAVRVRAEVCMQNDQDRGAATDQMRPARDGCPNPQGGKPESPPELGSPQRLGPSNVPARRIEVLWFDRTDVSLRYKCQTGLLTSEPCSPWLTDTDNAHTDNAIKSHLTAEMMAGRLEKRGACARCAHHTLKHSDASSAARGELLVDIRMFASRGDFDTHDLLVRGGVG